MKTISRIILPVLIVIFASGSFLPYPGSVNSLAINTAFTEVTAAAGLTYRDSTWGWAWGDYDGDGFIDLFLGHHPALSEIDGSRSSALMHNETDGTFTNQIGSSGILLAEDRHDMAFVDFDNDGDLDLWVSIGGRGGMGDGPKQLYRQDSAGVFVDVATEAGVVYPPGRGRGTAWLDYDLDGDLDMVFTGAERVDAPNAFFRNNGDGTFTNVTTEVGLDAFVGAQSQASVADYDQDGDPDLMVTGLVVRLYRNDGGYFTPVQDAAGITTRGAQGADWGDFDNDGDLDVYITRGSSDLMADYEELSTNHREIRFVATAQNGDEDGLDFNMAAGSSLTLELQTQEGGNIFRSTSNFYLGADSHNPSSNPFTITDGELVGEAPVYTPGVSSGIYIWQDAPGSWHIRWTGIATIDGKFSGILTGSSSITSLTEILFEAPQVSDVANHLLQNNGDGTFTEIGAAAGVDYTGDSRGADWGDYDNDGYLDLFVATNGTEDANPADCLYHNNGNGTFTNVAAAAGVTGTIEGGTWGGLFADYDNDGFLDLLTSYISASWPLDLGGYQLFHNDGNTNGWIKINLTSELTNSQGYGTKIWVTANGETQFQEVDDSSHYFTHYTGPLHFGVGTAEQIERVVIEWPDGTRDVYTDIPVDRLFNISQVDGIDWQAEPTQLSIFIPFIRR